jgi:hypothetical protein
MAEGPTFDTSEDSRLGVCPIFRTTTVGAEKLLLAESPRCASSMAKSLKELQLLQPPLFQGQNFLLPPSSCQEGFYGVFTSLPEALAHSECLVRKISCDCVTIAVGVARLNGLVDKYRDPESGNSAHRYRSRCQKSSKSCNLDVMYLALSHYGTGERGSGNGRLRRHIPSMRRLHSSQ